MRCHRMISGAVETGLRFTGIWPEGSYQVQLRLGWIIVMAVSQILQYWYIAEHLSLADLSDLVDGVSTSLPYSLLFFKLIVFWLNRGRFAGVLARMSRDWLDSSEASSRTMTRKAMLSNRCSRLTVAVYGLAVFLYSAAMIEQVGTGGQDRRESSRDLLIKMKIPEFCFESPIYEFLILGQFLHLFAIASSIGTLNGLIISLMLHIGGQIEILYDALIKVPGGEMNRLSRATVRSLLSRHYRIVAFTTEVQKLFSYIALLQFLSNTLIICCIGFAIMISFGTEQGVQILVKSSFFYVAITLEAFIFCFSGEYLRGKSQTISDAAYGSRWYNLKPDDCRVLSMVMMRSQKRLTITAGNFAELSLSSFAGILKASASYASVLHAMY